MIIVKYWWRGITTKVTTGPNEESLEVSPLLGELPLALGLWVFNLQERKEPTSRLKAQSNTTWETKILSLSRVDSTTYFNESKIFLTL